MTIFGSRDRYTFENPLASDPAGRMRFEPVSLSDPHNPILAEIRYLIAQPWHKKGNAWDQIIYEWFLRYVDDPTANFDGDPLWTEAHRDHARRVLTRLANFCTTNEQEPNA
jgi:hypothetical protein